MQKSIFHVNSSGRLEKSRLSVNITFMGPNMNYFTTKTFICDTLAKLEKYIFLDDHGGHLENVRHLEFFSRSHFSFSFGSVHDTLRSCIHT